MISSLLFPPRRVPMLLVDWELAGITPPSPPPGAPPWPVEAPPPTDLPVPVREPPKPTPTPTEQVREQALARRRYEALWDELVALRAVPLADDVRINAVIEALAHAQMVYKATPASSEARHWQ